MKKIKVLLLIALLVLFMPFVVNAKEYCKVVSGNGKDIGSEIACGTEHFYIIDSNKEEVKMLAKYNLNVGLTIYKEKINKELDDTRTDEEYCNDLVTQKGGILKRDSFYSENGYCFFALSIQTDKILQSKEAISAHWDKDGNYLYPQVGDVYYDLSELQYFSTYYNLNTDYDSYYDVEKSSINDTKFYDYNFKYEKYNDSMPLINYNSMGYPYGILNSLGHYKSELTDMNFKINQISLLSISELNDIVNKITNRSLPLKDWSDNYNVVSQIDSPGFHTTTNTQIDFGDLKNYIPNDYSWIYSTSYWNRTVFRDEGSWGNTYFVFTSGLGKICGAGFVTCAPGTAIGTGIRPVITIPTSEIQYLIKTETDGHGTIEVVDNALGNDTIQFKATSNKGYKLKSIVIKTDGGEIVKFDEGEIIDNGDGTYSVDKNKFTMPFENVTIQARWGLDILNPKTGMFYYTIVIMLLVVGISTYIYKKKNLKNI